MEIFIEPVEAAPRLWLFGAGHVAKPTAALARSVGFDVTVVDEREELNNEERFPACRREVCEPLALLDATALDAGDWLLITTHDHRLDEEVLARALRTPARFIGLVGSRRKTFRLLQRIDAKREAEAAQAQAQELGGVAPPLDRSRLFAPVGLDIGALGPEEIAVSVVAELVALRRGRAAAHLRAVDDVRLLRRIGGA
jgi:xanthine dehydrogenase accessory factor